MKMIRSAALLALLAGSCTTPAAVCDDIVRVADLPAALDEASGIAASRRHPGVLWAHNDSEGTPLLYALDHRARLLAEIALPAARAQSDWEDIATGPCATGDCIYIGDIGDNLHDRTDRAVLRVAEPALAGSTGSAVERFPFRYPDGPEDAEALFVTEAGGIYIVTKGRRSPVSVYRFPQPLHADSIATLIPVQRLTDGIAQLPDLVTGADARGDLVAIRTYSAVRLYRLTADTLALEPARSIDLAPLREPQGEGVAFAGADTLLLVTETGPQRATPFLSRTACTQR